MQIILFIFACIGATHIIVDGQIFEPIRNLAKKYLPNKMYYMFECYQCAGVYAGWLCGALVFTDVSIWQILACGFAGSFLANFAAMTMNYLEAQTIINIEKGDDGK